MQSYRCDLCGGDCAPRGAYTVLGRHKASPWQCTACSYAFIPEAHWLKEAYSAPMTVADLGPVNRCFGNARRTKSLLEFLRCAGGPHLDFGGGYGLFVRRMRDLGYRFYRFDTHCPNLFAQGFDAGFPNGRSYDMITAFEVLEHLVRPATALHDILTRCEVFVFSTLLLPDPFPEFDRWWYFGPEHGQHVSFYGARTLELLARKYGKNFYTNGGDFHVITSMRMTPRTFNWMIDARVTAAIEFFRPRPTLLDSDFADARAKALRVAHVRENGSCE